MHFSLVRALIITSLLIVGVTLVYLSSWYVGEKSGLIIIDTSLSMAVEDIRDGERWISRLDLAKRVAQEEIQEGEDNLALMTYARSPSLLSPLSGDQATLRSLVDGLLPTDIAGGSDLMSALELAKGLYGDIPLSLSIYTDGGSTNTTLPQSLPRHWRVSLIGIGTTEGGRIPLGYNADSTRRYKYYSGSEVVVVYEREYMESLSEALGSSLTHLTDAKEIETMSPGTGHASWYLLGLMLAFLGFFLHPYVRK